MPSHYKRRWRCRMCGGRLWVVGVVLIAACSSATDGSCTAADDCGAGETCRAGSCLRLCNSTSDCERGAGCDEGVCVATGGSNTLPPSITSVDGSGSADAQAEHAPHHLTSKLVVRGARLLEATFTLSGGGVN